MNKKNIWIIALVALPIIAMMVACLPNAVTYYHPAGDVEYLSYFGLMEGMESGICIPAAGIAVGLCILFAVAYAVSKKNYWLKAVSGPSFAAALLAVMPLLMPEEIKAAPNVIVPIAMLLEWLVAYQMGKTSENAPIAKEKGRRLGK